jgi:hypothetical protein
MIEENKNPEGHSGQKPLHEEEDKRGDHGHTDGGPEQHHSHPEKCGDDGVVILWKLNVQGVMIESREPKITVRHAIKEAGFNPETPWIIVLKIAGEPKHEVDLSFVIDLRHTGIEKLRLTPRHINNGEMAAAPRMDFALLPGDEAHLARLGLAWDAVNDGGRRWLILRNYPLPAGYTVSTADIAIEIPVSYPGAQLDMFYCCPPLALASGAVIPQTQSQETITGRVYQRWSRHRDWNAACDTLVTHLALLDESLSREVEA